MAAEKCPCGSGERYRLCCRPFHRNEQEAPDCRTLVRTRFSAYALKEVDYLWKTLHAEHPDRKGDEAAQKADLRRGASAVNFARLFLLDADERPPGETSRVLFSAEIYEKGKPRGFTELSEFRHDGQGWRYVGGEMAAFTAGPMTLAQFQPKKT